MLTNQVISVSILGTPLKMNDRNLQNHQMSHEKNPYYFLLYWMVNRDPYNGLL